MVDKTFDSLGKARDWARAESATLKADRVIIAFRSELDNSDYYLVTDDSYLDCDEYVAFGGHLLAYYSHGELD